MLLESGVGDDSFFLRALGTRSTSRRGKLQETWVCRQKYLSQVANSFGLD